MLYISEHQYFSLRKIKLFFFLFPSNKKEFFWKVTYNLKNSKQACKDYFAIKKWA